METREFRKDDHVTLNNCAGVWRVLTFTSYGSGDGGHTLKLRFVAGTCHGQTERDMSISSLSVRKLTDMEVIALASN